MRLAHFDSTAVSLFVNLRPQCCLKTSGVSNRWRPTCVSDKNPKADTIKIRGCTIMIIFNAPGVGFVGHFNQKSNCLPQNQFVSELLPYSYKHVGYFIFLPKVS